MPKRSKYEVPDPWHTRVAQWWAGHVMCPVFGHRWGAKMYGQMCHRCATYRPRGSHAR